MRRSVASRTAAVLCFATACLFPGACAQKLDLEPGVTVERDLAAGEVHAYRLTPVGNRYLRLAVEQQGIDVVVQLDGPDDRLPLDFDSLSGSNGPDPVYLVTEAPGSFRLEIHAPLRTEPGSYRLTIEEARNATPRDRRRVAAAWALAAGEGLRKQGEPAAAIAKHQEALRIRAELADDDGVGDVCFYLGRIHQEEGNLEEAHRYLEQARGAFHARGDDLREISVLDRLGKIDRRAGRVEEALDHRRQALEMSREIQDRKSEAASLHNLALIYKDVGEIREALRAYEQALTLFQELGDRSDQAETLHSLGRAYLSRGQSDRAVRFFEEALELRQEIGDRRGQARVLNSLGNACQVSGEWQRALDRYLLEALKVHQELGDQRAEATTRNDIGNAYYRLGQLEPARHNLRKALEVLQEQGSLRARIVALNSLGRLETALDSVPPPLLPPRGQYRARARAAPTGPRPCP